MHAHTRVHSRNRDATAMKRCGAEIKKNKPVFTAKLDVLPAVGTVRRSCVSVAEKKKDLLVCACVCACVCLFK